MTRQAQERLLRMPDVIDQVGLNRTTIYKFIAEGRFPAPRKIGRVSVWSEQEVQQWIYDFLAQSTAVGTPA